MNRPIDAETLTVAIIVALNRVAPNRGGYSKRQLLKVTRALKGIRTEALLMLVDDLARRGELEVVSAGRYPRFKLRTKLDVVGGGAR